MAHRILDNVDRPEAVTLTINGERTEAYAGEKLVTVLLAAGETIFKLDGTGAPRGPFCNMGVCYDCLVDVRKGEGPARRVRACMTDVEQGLDVRTVEVGHDD